MPNPRITIIGAGPAGAVAGILLARHGWRVTIIEQHRFPRDKVCGECLSPMGIYVLRRLGLMQRVLEMGPTLLKHAILHAGGGRQARLALPSAQWGISRLKLDAMLLDAAREAGAEILQPARCERIDCGDWPRIQVRDLQTNRVSEWETPCVLLADGKGGLLPHRPPATGDFGIKAHYRNICGPADTIEFFGAAGCYGGIAPVEDETWNLAFRVPGRMLAEHGRDMDGLMRHLARQNAAMARRLDGASRCAAWLTSPLPRHGVTRGWPMNVFPIGNAAAAIEPIGGEGMGLAMRSAELASWALLGGCSRRAAARDLQRKFQEMWRLRRIVCRAAAEMLASSSWDTLLVSVIRACPALARRGLLLMGKYV